MGPVSLHSASLLMLCPRKQADVPCEIFQEHAEVCLVCFITLYLMLLAPLYYKWEVRYFSEHGSLMAS